jgi:membrane-associated phospholipid phosphatase/protein-S-isoprenylcysteine O-methyltransferase Ste14
MGNSRNSYVEMKINPLIGKILYGSLFMILTPIMLWFWAYKTESSIELPALKSDVFGLILISSSTLIILRGMLDLWIYGKGLPMNAYPPKRFVREGIYRYLSHPIYVGSGILSIGLSIYFGSKSGLWLVSPLFILGMFSLILGYEQDAIQSIFKPKDYFPLISIPINQDMPIKMWARFSFLILVLFPWLFLYELITFRGVPSYAHTTYFPFEMQLPVWGFTEVFYFAAYPFIFLLPFFIKRNEILRGSTLAGILMVITGLFIHFFIPLIAPFRAINTNDSLGYLLLIEREYSSPAGAFPSFHVAWSFFAAYYYSLSFPSLKKLFFTLAFIISLSCITTGMHSIIDVIAGWFLFYFAINYKQIGLKLKEITEKLANSYEEKFIGKMRIISHAKYAGWAGFIGAFFISYLTNEPVIVFFIGLCSMIGAGLWAQIVESSAKISRPFGYFGCILGGALATTILCLFFDLDFCLMFAASAVAVPWAQGVGRFRCWVQGCCHGKLTTEQTGICYHHPRSRVLVNSNMGHLPLHNTQLYSVISSFVIGFILTSLWFNDANMPTITGLYFILTGLSRFVEEHYRGEPQTPIYFGLRLYQFLAIGFVLLGMTITCFTYNIPKPIFQQPEMALVAAFSFGFLAAFMMGMDFPYSKKRYSRLASVDDVS